MKKWVLLLVFALIVGCDYTVPLLTTPTTEIDKSVLGLWQNTSDNKTSQLLVLPLDKNEYLVSYPANATNDTMYARACLCHAGDQTLVQLKWLGTGDGEASKDSRVYQFLSYSTAGNQLTIRLLNTDVVSKDVTTSGDLAKAIIANKDKTNLFETAAVFTRVNN